MSHDAYDSAKSGAVADSKQTLLCTYDDVRQTWRHHPGAVGPVVPHETVTSAGRPEVIPDGSQKARVCCYSMRRLLLAATGAALTAALLLAVPGSVHVEPDTRLSVLSDGDPRGTSSGGGDPTG
ncbi:hypothetical protein Cme02nite_00730 [Catellatospora methionotrophica]|uniref:Uncharacterized protein n=1 Tax=Catellatospora methionotrophica TaxID=121620 RepID=A0A8J3PE37_9ACTN|nr:hypothetical protein Cme02nite_00730 [Catellatospora methionotrophica]